MATDQKPSPSGVWAVGSCHHTGIVPVQAEDVVWEAARKGVEIGQVDLAEVVSHGAILVTAPVSVKNGAPGA